MTNAERRQLDEQGFVVMENCMGGDLLRELRASGVSVVLTTHAMDEAETLADQVFIVDEGVVKVSGTVAELTAAGDTLEDVFLAQTRPGAAS